MDQDTNDIIVEIDGDSSAEPNAAIAEPVHFLTKQSPSLADKGKPLFYSKIVNGIKHLCCSFCSTKYKAVKTSPVTNMKSHIRNKHANEWKQFQLMKSQEAENLNRQSSRPEKVQKTIDETLIFNQERATKALSVMLGVSSSSYNLVNDIAFEAFCKELSPLFKVPSRYVVQKSLVETLSNIEASIKSAIKGIPVSTCADIWSKKDMTSYMGITAHYFDCESQSIANVALDLKQLHGSYTGLEIKRLFWESVDDWDIPREAVSKVLSDDGSNVVKAFNELLTIENRYNKPEPTEPDMALEGGEHIDASFDEEEWDAMLNSIDPEDVMVSLGNRRLPCVVHKSQLIVGGIIKSEPFAPLVKETLRLVAKIQKSTVATDKLVTAAGKRLISHCPTRWNTVCFVFKRLLELRNEVTSVVNEMGIDGLLASQWKKLEIPAEFLQCFADVSEEWASANKVTASLIIPHLKLLRVKVQMSAVDESIKQMVLDDMEKRFGLFTNTSHSHFEPLFAAATLLDPRFNGLFLISDNGNLKVRAVDYLKAFQANYNDLQAHVNGPPAEHAKGESSDKTCDDLFEQMLMEQDELKSGTSVSMSLTEEAEKLLAQPRAARDLDPLKFWCSDDACRFPGLKRIACHVLSIPASSASVERLFSKAGLSCLGRRERLKGDNLRAEVMLKVNYFNK